MLVCKTWTRFQTSWITLDFKDSYIASFKKEEKIYKRCWTTKLYRGGKKLYKNTDKIALKQPRIWTLFIYSGHSTPGPLKGSLYLSAPVSLCTPPPTLTAIFDLGDLWGQSRSAERTPSRVNYHQPARLRVTLNLSSPHTRMILILN